MTYTYTLTNGTSADADQVMTDFNDVKASLTDGTKDISVAAITAAGAFTASSTATFTGLVTGVEEKEIGQIHNLGLSLSAGVCSITDAGGSALSTSNKAYVVCPSTTAGRAVVLRVTTPFSFNDDSHASSSLTNFGAGITEAAHWANNMPWFVYAVNRGNADFDGTDGNSVFAITRNPSMTVTPSAAGNIGDTGAIPATDDQTSILILDDVTVANYTSLPCVLIGAFRMQWSTTTDDWTVQTIGNSDGFGADQLRKTFANEWTMPIGQNGAMTSRIFNQNGATTVANWASTVTLRYMISQNGCIRFFGTTRTGGNVTNGTGASVQAQLAIPAVITDGDAAGTSRYISVGHRRLATSESVMLGTLIYGTSYVGLLLDSGSAVNTDSFSDSADDISWDFTYKAFA